jgi:thiosulfate dehydrogenase
MRSFLIGFLAALLTVAGGAGVYVVSGRAPVAVTDPPLPFEKALVGIALDSHIQRQQAQKSPLPADEATLTAGAHVYRSNCAGCHSLPGQSERALGASMYPAAPELFKGQGVTDDPVFESYWKVSNGIRLTGMPAFNLRLHDAQLWQVSLLVAHANGLPDSAKKLLEPGPPSTVPAPAAPATGPGPRLN